LSVANGNNDCDEYRLKRTSSGIRSQQFLDRVERIERRGVTFFYHFACAVVAEVARVEPLHHRSRHFTAMQR
jgi:hypothetical protein